MNLQDAGSVWNVSAGGLGVGDAGTGELDMSTGARLVFASSAAFGIGVESGGRGTLAADGAGTMIDARQAFLTVGRAVGAQGILRLNDGASLLLGQDTFVGDAGGGSLTVSGAGQASIGTDTGTRTIKFGVGNQGGGVGNVSVQGPGSQVYMGDYVLTFVGVDGNGFFGVGSGGTVRTSALELGGDIAATGQIVVDGAGSSWTNTDVTLIGGSSKQPGGHGHS